MTEPTSAGIDGPGEQQRPRRSINDRVSTRAVLVISAALAVVLVLALAASVFFWRKYNDAQNAQSDRAAATAVASQFALRMDKVDGTNFDSYIKGVDQMLTTKAKTKNQQTFGVLKQSYEAAKVKGTGKVLLTGVGSSDSDSATVLVVHDADVTTTQGEIQHHYRWSVDVVKVGTSWLVDDFNPVN